MARRERTSSHCSSSWSPVRRSPPNAAAARELVDRRPRPPSAPEVPIIGLAGIAFRVSDLAKARAYYQGVLGFAEAFSTKDQSGRVASVYFKINDDQYVEVVPDMKPGELRRQARVMFQSSDLKKLHAIYTERGLTPHPDHDRSGRQSCLPRPRSERRQA